MENRLSLEDMVLAALSPAGCETYRPLQVQKLFFLLDGTIATRLGGAHFRFEQSDFGPFDPGVYGALEELAADGLVSIRHQTARRRTYSLTPAGLTRGRQVLNESFDDEAQGRLARLNERVRSMSYVELVSAR